MTTDAFGPAAPGQPTGVAQEPGTTTLPPEPDRPGLKAVIARVRGEFGGLLLVSCLINLLALTTSIYMLQVFDRVLSSGSMETLFWLTVIALAAVALLALFELARKRVLVRAGHWFETAAAPRVVAAAGDDRLAGRPPAAGLSDVADVRSFLTGDGVPAFLDAPWMPLFIAVMFLLHPWLGVLALGGAIVLFACALANDVILRKRAEAARDDQQRARAAAHELAEKAELLRGLGMARPAFARWRQAQEAALPGALSLADAGSAIGAFSRMIRMALQVGVLGTGAYLVLNQQLTPGGMIAGSILLARALAPVEKSIAGWRGWVSARAALGKLREVAARPAQAERQALPVPRGQLELQGVTHTPGALEAPILRDVSFTLEPGRVLGVVGPSGSGKSTLCRLIVGAQAPSAGEVRLDGAPVAENVAQLAPYIGWLPQEVAFVSGSVAQNLARLSDAPDAGVIAAAEEADVHALILRLPDGYETDLGAYGPRLSGGQRQRLALARALYGAPRLLVLDEPSSSLDQAGEAALMRAVAAAKRRGAAVVLVSHQPALMRLADEMLVMRDGAVERLGPRDEIMRLYATRKKPQGAAPGEDAPAAPAPAAAAGAGGDAAVPAE